MNGIETGMKLPQQSQGSEGSFKKEFPRGGRGQDLADKELEGSLTPEESAELSAYREFPHINAGVRRELVIKEKLGTISENEKSALEIVRESRRRSGTGMTLEERARFWDLLDNDNG